MSALTAAQKGLDAVDRKDWDAAIDLLSQAIAASAAAHANPAWLLARATALQHRKQYARALADAERAYTSALFRSPPKQRELLALIQYRRAVALAALGRFADADACCLWSQQLIAGKNFRTDADDVAANVDADGNYLATAAQARAQTRTMPASEPGSGGRGGGVGGGKVEGASEWTRAFVWRAMVLGQMEALPAGAAGRKITVLRVPDPARPTVVEDPAAAAAATTPAPTTPTTTTTTTTPKLRVDMFQSADKVSLTLYAKGVDAAALAVRFSDAQHVHLGPLPAAVAGPAGAIQLALGGAVDTRAEAVKTTVTPYKIELGLTKTGSDRWGSWGAQVDAAVPVEGKVAAPAKPQESVSAAAPAVAPKPQNAGAAAPKDWEKVLEAEAGADEPDSDVNSFFKKLYASSGPEAQRAMMKSFVESNGTALSTDWATVSTKRVETQPPEGVDVKKWA